MHLSDALRDHDAGMKLSAARIPLVVWFVIVTLFTVALGVALLWSGIHCLNEACEPLSYNHFSGYLDRAIDAFWAFGSIYVGGKGMGKMENVMIGSDE